MTPDDVKERLEQAGYAIQKLPTAGPKEYGTNWPDVPRTSLEAWVLQIHADYEQKAEIIADAHRHVSHATREQIAALDDALGWLLSIGEIPVRRIVWLRMFRHPLSERYKYSWKYIGKIYGYSQRHCRYLHARGLDTIVQRLRKAA